VSRQSKPNGKKLGYLRWFEGDFSGEVKVRRMGKLPRLLYRCLLQSAWASSKPPYLSNDDVELEFMSDAPSPEDWQRCKAEVLAMFQKTPDGKFLFHGKMLLEYERAKAIQERHSEGATVTNSKRWGKRNRHGNGTKQSSYDPIRATREAAESQCK
jgi:hypothetical protein